MYRADLKKINRRYLQTSIRKLVESSKQVLNTVDQSNHRKTDYYIKMLRESIDKVYPNFKRN